MSKTLKVTTTTPSGPDSEEIELAPSSAISFERNDGKRYTVVVDDTLAELALVDKKG
jgi:hypothetical protein